MLFLDGEYRNGWMAKHNDFGKWGEQKAADYLLQKGYVILERNWRLGHKELDIICLSGELLVIVEVKTRHIPEERPAELLDFNKRKNLRRAADVYIRSKGIKREVRFDLILVTGENGELEHIPEVIQVFE